MDATVALDSSVLVLNRSFVAVHIVSARRAFALLFKEIAEVISVDEDDKFSTYNFHSWQEVSEFKAQFEEKDESEWVRTVSFEIKVPRVIRLVFYDRLPKRSHVRFNRRNIFARDGNRCQYCGRRFPSPELSLEHVVPRSRGGKTSWDNIVCACTECNRRKGGRTPREAGMRLIRKPGRPLTNPVLVVKLRSDKYQSWKHFIDEAYWSVPLEE